MAAVWRSRAPRMGDSDPLCNAIMRILLHGGRRLGPLVARFTRNPHRSPLASPLASPPARRARTRLARARVHGMARPLPPLRRSRNGSQYARRMGLGCAAAALWRPRADPPVARPRLVDDPSGGTARAARALCRTRGARLRPARAAGAAPAVALGE